MSRLLRSKATHADQKTSSLVASVHASVKSGVGVSDAVRATLASHNITDPAAFDRLRKAWQRSGAAAHNASVLRPHGQTLSVLQEEALVQVVAALGAAGTPISPSQLAAVASSTFNAPTDLAWSNRFFTRHAGELRLATPKATAARRKAETTLEATERWTEFMLTQADYLAAKPERISNADECRMSTQEIKTLRLLFARNSKLSNVSRARVVFRLACFTTHRRSPTRRSSARASCHSVAPTGRLSTFSL
jgi:hypothetical protein